MRKCKCCPYIYEELLSKNIENYDSEVEMIESCWCDKVGGQISVYGCCSNTNKDTPLPTQPTKRVKKSKRERDLKHKTKLIKISKYSSYPTPCVCKEEIWIRGIGYKKLDKPYYKRIYRGSRPKNRWNYYKKVSNRLVRRYRDGISNGCTYKKIFDYWGECI